MHRLPTPLLGAMLVSAGFAAAAELGPWKPVALPAAAAAADLRGVCFVDDRHGWIVGDKGLCLATSDGGATWERRETGTDATLRCVRFTDVRHGFACGDGDSRAPLALGHMVFGRPLKQGTVLATSDGGATWQKKWVPCNFEIWCVEGATAPRIQVGIGLDTHLDGDIVRSEDGGATWRHRRIFRSLADIRAVDATRWVAVGSPVTVDFLGGPISDPAHRAAECRALYSDDAGATWQVSEGSDGRTVLRGILVCEGLPLLAVGDAGAVLASDDAGRTWRAVRTPARGQLRGIAAAGDRPAAIVVVGERGVSLASLDAGRTWLASAAGTDKTLHAVAACGPRFIAVGAGGTALECTAAALAAARDLPPASQPPEPGTPIPKASPEQRARVRVGDSTLVTHAMRVAALGTRSEWQIRTSITAVHEDTCTVVTELVKGTPPAGMLPERRSEQRVPIADLAATEATPAVGATRVEEQRVPEIEATLKITHTRRPDATLEVAGAKLSCMVVETVTETPGEGRSTTTEWRCPETVPCGGLVKLDATQPMQLPLVGAVNATFTQTLDEWTRGPE